MSCNQLASPEEQIRQLQERLKSFTIFALAHEEWEAAALNDDGPWIDNMPEDIHDKFMEVQKLRNEALGI